MPTGIANLFNQVYRDQNMMAFCGIYSNNIGLREEKKQLLIQIFVGNCRKKTGPEYDGILWNILKQHPQWCGIFTEKL